MGAVLYWISKSNIILIARWYHLALLGFIGLGIYFGILILLREFTRKDFDFILDTLSIRKMWKYITDEIKRE
jgi:hypothetical protein